MSEAMARCIAQSMKCLVWVKGERRSLQMYWSKGEVKQL